MRHRPRVLALTIVLLAAPTLFACEAATDRLVATASAGLPKERPARAPEEARGVSDNVLVVGGAADAIGLDPARFTDNESVEACDQMYERLVRYAPNSTDVMPALATSWDVSRDGLAWTFHLRQGVRFHDGTPLDADAVTFSFERQRDRTHPFHNPDFTYWENSYASVVKKVEAIDPATVRIHLFQAYAPFLAALAMFPVSIVSPTAVQRWGDKFPEHPVGTGPFRFASWIPGERMVLERNYDYWGEVARVNRLVFRTLPDAHQRLLALESGGVDVAYAIPPEKLQFVALHPRLSLHRAAGQNVVYLAMHTQKPPFDDPNVRRALNHAVNKLAIVKLAYQGLAVPARGAVPPTVWGYRDDLRDYAYDPDRARALLAEAVGAGTFDPERTYTLYVPRQPRGYLSNPEVVARVIQHNLAAVGLKTELVFQDVAQHLRDVQWGRHDLCLLGWAGDHSDPDNFLYMLLDSDNAIPGRARNVAFYLNPRVHALLLSARSSNDRDERERIYADAQLLIAEDAPWVPIAHSQSAVASSNRVQGLTLSPAGVIVYASVSLGPPDR